MTFWDVHQSAVSANIVAPGSIPDISLTWGTDGDSQNTFPWALADYPALLVLSISFTVATSAVVAGRRARLVFGQPTVLGGAYTEVRAAATVNASQIRTYEFAVGYGISSGGSGTVIREPLPEGLVILPSSNPDVGAGNVRVVLDNAQAGDSILGNLYAISGLILHGIP